MHLSLEALPITLENLSECQHEIRAHTGQRLFEPAYFPAACIDWTLTRTLNSCSSESERLMYLRRVLRGTRTAYTAIDGSQGGDIGCAINGKPTRAYYTHEASISNFLDAVNFYIQNKSTKIVYAQSRPLRDFPRLISETEWVARSEEVAEASSRLWIGSGGHVNGLHFDCFGNFLFLSGGKKRICLFPPDCLQALRPTPPRGGVGGATSSSIKLLRPTDAQKDSLEHISALGKVVILNPGDALYIPPNWWHHVEGVGLNIMINIWIHTIGREIIVDLERGLRRLIRNTRGISQDDLELLRKPVKRACEGKEIDRAKLTQLVGPSTTGTLLEIGSLLMPTAWRLFASVAADYYIFECRSDASLCADVERWASSVYFPKPFLTKVN